MLDETRRRAMAKKQRSGTVRLTDPIRQGEILCDVAKRKWKLGRPIGVGAFGEIYLASDDISKHVGSDAKYVVKVEPHSNGPLFVEMNFYLRATKREMIEDWKREKRLKTLGVPALYSFGSHIYKGERFRFLVLPRLGDDIHKIFLKHSKRFHVKTAFTLAYHIMDSLEYIHHCGYVHSDIKGMNLAVGEREAPVYLFDFGLAMRYVYRNGVHKEYTPDDRRAEVGTLEFSSRDSHIGAVSRRSDLESLGYNVIRWLEGRLPWDSELANPQAVKTLKDKSMANINAFINTAFTSAHHKPPGVLADYLSYVAGMDFETTPDYAYCKRLFCKGIRDAGFLDDTRLTFHSHAKLPPNSRKRLAECENLVQPKRTRLGPVSNRKPCAVFNHNMPITRVMTRNLERVGPRLRSHEFDWTMVLATNPEKIFLDKKPKDKRTSKPPEQNNRRVDQKRELSGCTGGVTVTGVRARCGDPDDLSNPTPAMIKVMERKKKRVSEPPPRRTRNDSWNANLCGEILTPAMEEVIANRQIATMAATVPTAKVLRSSTRKCAANANAILDRKKRLFRNRNESETGSEKRPFRKESADR